MRTLNISIPDLEYKMFGIKNDQLSFSDFVNIVSKALAKQKLDKSMVLAEQSGLSKMTIDEITEEVKAMRKNKKDHH